MPENMLMKTVMVFREKISIFQIWALCRDGAGDVYADYKWL